MSAGVGPHQCICEGTGESRGCPGLSHCATRVIRVCRTVTSSSRGGGGRGGGGRDDSAQVPQIQMPLAVALQVPVAVQIDRRAGG